MSIGCNGETEYLGLKSAEEYESALESLPVEISDVDVYKRQTPSCSMSRLFKSIRSDIFLLISAICPFREDISCS